MHYEGKIDAPVSAEKFYAFITDPQSIISILPDVVESNIADDRHFSVKAKAGVSYLKGSMDIRFEVVEKKEGSLAKILGHGQGMQSSLEMAMKIELAPASPGTLASWTADLSIGGLLASVGGRLIDGVASKYMSQITQNLKQKVSA